MYAVKVRYIECELSISYPDIFAYGAKYYAVCWKNTCSRSLDDNESLISHQ